MLKLQSADSCANFLALHLKAVRVVLTFNFINYVFIKQNYHSN